MTHDKDMADILQAWVYGAAEEYWRKKIADEIEALRCEGKCYGVNQEHCDYINDAADVAAGITNG